MLIWKDMVEKQTAEEEKKKKEEEEEKKKKEEEEKAGIYGFSLSMEQLGSHR